MDIICMCGHKAFHHEDYKRIDKVVQCLDFPPCDCELTEREVYEIYITEQQAHLDTNLAQVEALVVELNTLKDYQKDCQEELENRREQYLTAIDRLIKTENERDALKAQKLELIKAVELFLDCKYDADEKARKILGEVCDA